MTASHIVRAFYGGRESRARRTSVVRFLSWTFVLLLIVAPELEAAARRRSVGQPGMYRTILELSSYFTLEAELHDGSLLLNNRIGLLLLHPNGEIETLPGTAGVFGPFAIAPDGTIWGTSYDKPITLIYRIGDDRRVTEFSLGARVSISTTIGADGNLWFVESHYLGRITSEGELNRWPLPTVLANPRGITRDRDGTLWIIAGRLMARVKSEDVFDIVPIPASFFEGRGPDTTGYGIRAMSDGSLWFVIPPVSHRSVGGPRSGSIVRMKPDGTFQEMYRQSSFYYLHGLTAGTDGAIWFTLHRDPTTSGFDKHLVRVGPDGSIRDILLPYFWRKSIGGWSSLLVTRDGRVLLTDGEANSALVEVIL
jgi:virginiamycin B lyase